MTPRLEEIGIRMLLNECEIITRDNQRIYLAGIDDAHFYHADNVEKAASEIPPDEFSILLSHTQEICRQAAHADFNLLQVAIPMEVKFASLATFRSPWTRFFHDIWARAGGNITT